MHKATFFYEKLVNLFPNSLSNWTKFLASINYHQNIHQKDYLSYCKKFDQIPKLSSSVTNKILNKKKIINLFFFSPDFKNH